MPALDSTKALKDKLDQQELKADELLCELIDKLYHHEANAIRFIILRDLYDLLEKIIDRVRDAGEVVYHIVLKNS
jgi:uncharacterized protein Yka (UPF0111/DUF47 family)